jgi:hypothetical protein
LKNSTKHWKFNKTRPRKQPSTIAEQCQIQTPNIRTPKRYLQERENAEREAQTIRNLSLLAAAKPYNKSRNLTSAHTQLTLGEAGATAKKDADNQKRRNAAEKVCEMTHSEFLVWFFGRNQLELKRKSGCSVEGCSRFAVTVRCKCAWVLFLVEESELTV